MEANIKGGPAFAYVDVNLAPGEAVVAESNAMSSMNTGIDLTATLNGGLVRGLMKKLFGGESLFISHYKNNTQQPQRLVLVRPVPGEIRCIALDNDEFHLQPGAFLASTAGVNLGLRWAGLISWIAGEGLFKLTVSGSGSVWYGAYGALIEKQVDGEYIVDTSHLVAYEPSITLKLQLVGGLFSTIFGGEGLVTRVCGKGKIIVQSRSISGLTAWLNPKFR